MGSRDGRDLSPPRPAVTIPAATQQAIADFLQYLMVERRLSPATQVAYRGVLHQFFTSWQQQGRETHLDLLSGPAVLQFLEARLQQEVSARSTARILAALRGFDRWLRLEGLRPVLALVDMQIRQPPRRLSHTLPQQDIDKLLQQPSRTRPIGLRDLAMLEVLYGSGLRVAGRAGSRVSVVADECPASHGRVAQDPGQGWQRADSPDERTGG